MLDREISAGARPCPRFLVLVPLLLLAGCANEDATLGVTRIPPAGATVSFKQDVQAIFADPRFNCAQSFCHGSPLGAPMSLEADKAYGALVGQPSCGAPALKRVDPGSSGTSYLVFKLAGTQSDIEAAGGCTGCAGFLLPGSCGDRMPFGGPTFLSDPEIQLIRDWIDQGAEDN